MNFAEHELIYIPIRGHFLLMERRVFIIIIIQIESIEFRNKISLSILLLCLIIPRFGDSRIYSISLVN